MRAVFVNSHAGACAEINTTSLLREGLQKFNSIMRHNVRYFAALRVSNALKGGEGMISAVLPDEIMLSETELARLIDQYGDGLLRICLLYLKDYALAEDAVQETFLKVYRNYAKFERRSSEKTWMTAIAINVCKNMLRSPWRRRIVGEEALEHICSVNPELPDPTVSRAVLNLPKDQRIAVTLFYVQGMKIREIAEALNIPIQTVSSRLSRARRRLHSELKGWYFDEE